MNRAWFSDNAFVSERSGRTFMFWSGTRHRPVARENAADDAVHPLYGDLEGSVSAAAVMACPIWIR